MHIFNSKLFWTILIATIFTVAVGALAMGLFTWKNQLPVEGRTIVVTGGSQGMGLAVAKLLSSKGAHVVIVARHLQKLRDAREHISSVAKWPESQRFYYISADLTNPVEATRVVKEVSEWNGKPPDIMWCCTGQSRPSLFVDAATEDLRQQMDVNYWTTAYMAHATLKAWLRPTNPQEIGTPGTIKGPWGDIKDFSPRHLIFTSSVLAFYPIAGYGPYSPAKAAMRSLSDTLSNELNLYRGSKAHGSGPVADVKIHTIFPGTIFSPGLEEENKFKHPLTKKLEEDDDGLTPEQCAERSVKSLEKGQYLITLAFLGHAMRSSSWGGSPRNNVIVDTVFTWITSLVWLFIQPDMDSKVWKWGKENGHPDLYPIGRK